MSRKFVIADLHLGHKNILKYEPAARPFATIEKHDIAIRDRWNETVTNGDVVYVIGDVALNARGLNKLEGLPGEKILIAGNHDTLRTEDYLRHFRKVVGALSLGRVLMTHIPVHPGSLGQRFLLNIHGHIHSQRVLTGDYCRDSRYMCVSAEHTNLTPLELGTNILKLMEHGA